MTASEFGIALVMTPPTSPVSRPTAMADLVVMQALGILLTDRQLAARWGMSLSTAHRIRKEAEDAGRLLLGAA